MYVSDQGGQISRHVFHSEAFEAQRNPPCEPRSRGRESAAERDELLNERLDARRVHSTTLAQNSEAVALGLQRLRHLVDVEGEETMQLQPFERGSSEG